MSSEEQSIINFPLMVPVQLALGTIHAKKYMEIAILHIQKKKRKKLFCSLKKGKKYQRSFYNSFNGNLCSISHWIQWQIYCHDILTFLPVLQHILLPKEWISLINTVFPWKRYLWPSGQVDLYFSNAVRERLLCMKCIALFCWSSI